MKITNRTRFFGMLGFAMRAGKVDTGADIIARELPLRTVKLVIVSSEASDATRKRMRTKCEFYKVKFAEIEVSVEDLSAHLGKISSTVCVGIKDDGFANEIIKVLYSE